MNELPEASLPMSELVPEADPGARWWLGEPFLKPRYRHPHDSTPVKPEAQGAASPAPEEQG